MSNPNDVQNWIGHTAVDSEGAKIGKIGQIYLDDRSGSPTWVTVSTGLFGTKESFAPLYRSSVSGDDLKLAVTKDLVKDAPDVDADQHMDNGDNRRAGEPLRGTPRHRRHQRHRHDRQPAQGLRGH